MAISRIATVSADAGSGNVSITHGLTILSGDVIVASINVNGAGNTVTDNNGSTAFTSDHNTANPDSATYYVFSRVCGGSEPSSYSWTLGSSNRWSVVLRQYRGVDASIWDVAPGVSTVSTGTLAATAVASSITINTSGAAALVLMGDDAFPTTTTFSGIDNSFGNNVSEEGQQYQVTSDKLGLSTGSTGATTVTSSANVSYVIYQVALKPATAVVYEQEGFRWRADDGSETTATWLASQDSNITRAKSATTRLRVLVNTTNNAPSTRYKLQYRKQGDDGWRDLKS